MIGALLLAWILSLFGFDDLFTKGFNELTGKNITTAGYYIVFFLIGLMFDLLKAIREGIS